MLILLAANVGVDSDDNGLAVHRGRAGLITVAAGNDQGLTAGAGRGRVLNIERYDYLLVFDFNFHCSSFFDCLTVTDY